MASARRPRLPYQPDFRRSQRALEVFQIRVRQLEAALDGTDLREISKRFDAADREREIYLSSGGHRGDGRFTDADRRFRAARERYNGRVTIDQTRYLRGLGYEGSSYISQREAKQLIEMFKSEEALLAAAIAILGRAHRTGSVAVEDVAAGYGVQRARRAMGDLVAAGRLVAGADGRYVLPEDPAA